MASYNKVDTYSLEEIGGMFLRCVGQHAVFVAPMHAHRHDVGSGATCGIDVGVYYFPVDIINHYSIARLNAIGAIGVIQKSYLYTVDIDYFRNRTHARGITAVCSYVSEAAGNKLGNGGPESPGTSVESVIIGSKEEVEPCICKRIDIRRGRIEARVALIGRRPHWRFEIHDCQVGTSDYCLKLSEALGKVVSAIGCSRGIALGDMLHCIPGKENFGLSYPKTTPARVSHNGSNHESAISVLLLRVYDKPPGCSASVMLWS